MIKKKIYLKNENIRHGFYFLNMLEFELNKKLFILLYIKNGEYRIKRSYWIVNGKLS